MRLGDLISRSQKVNIIRECFARRFCFAARKFYIFIRSAIVTFSGRSWLLTYTFLNTQKFPKTIYHKVHLLQFILIDHPNVSGLFLSLLIRTFSHTAHLFGVFWSPVPSVKVDD
jgi:hypothetical protein